MKASKRSLERAVLTQNNSKGLSSMKASKRSLERACGYGQHVLDKHDRDI